MITSTKRPKYLNLLKIRLPIPGIASIAHRISGVLMFLAIPLLVYLLHLSSISESGYLEVIGLMDAPLAKLIILILAWSAFHHLFAGIRYLLIDMDIGVEKYSAWVSALVVLIAGIASAIIVLLGLL